jgi:hypothetical protein
MVERWLRNSADTGGGTSGAFYGYAGCLVTMLALAFVLGWAFGDLLAEPEVVWPTSVMEPGRLSERPLITPANARPGPGGTSPGGAAEGSSTLGASAISVSGKMGGPEVPSPSAQPLQRATDRGGIKKLPPPRG